MSIRVAWLVANCKPETEALLVLARHSCPQGESEALKAPASQLRISLSGERCFTALWYSPSDIRRTDPSNKQHHRLPSINGGSPERGYSPNRWWVHALVMYSGWRARLRAVS